MKNWILLHYTLPSRPSARRVYIWRKLKRLGAILLNDAIWILPETPRTLEQFQWLTAEIQEMKGDAYLWRSNLFFATHEDSLINQFMEQADSSYKELLKKINKKNPDLTELSREYQQITGRNYFNSELGKQVREKLLLLKGGDS